MLALPQWMLAAGFIRNLAWDRLHGTDASPFTDIDLIYFDPTDLSRETERRFEAKLRVLAPEYPWSVKNQARMHLRNGDKPYSSALDAMGYWPEKETAIAVSLSPDGAAMGDNSLIVEGCGIVFSSAFGLESLFQLQLTPNPKRPLTLFNHRLRTKGWLYTYPRLQNSSHKP
ncbi:nucleotidyltransferase family protein [Shewanella canadensis]|nr:nucleotidyltransferase family protein [Shewanella canadensis]